MHSTTRTPSPVLSAGPFKAANRSVFTTTANGSSITYDLLPQDGKPAWSSGSGAALSRTSARPRPASPAVEPVVSPEPAAARCVAANRLEAPRWAWDASMLRPARHDDSIHARSTDAMLDALASIEAATTSRACAASDPCPAETLTRAIDMLLKTCAAWVHIPVRRSAGKDAAQPSSEPHNEWVPLVHALQQVLDFSPADNRPVDASRLLRRALACFNEDPRFIETLAARAPTPPAHFRPIEPAITSASHPARRQPSISSSSSSSSSTSDPESPPAKRARTQDFSSRGGLAFAVASDPALDAFYRAEERKDSTERHHQALIRRALERQGVTLPKDFKLQIPTADTGELVEQDRRRANTEAVMRLFGEQPRHAQVRAILGRLNTELGMQLVHPNGEAVRLLRRGVDRTKNHGQ